MSYSRRAQTVRRLTGGAMLALCVGLAIERAGAQQQQQQTSAGANVNVIAGTGADGDWTLQRQNEPSIACSSRNPRNCIAGANDYRTVDIPFPAVGERVTGDAWLGWYTTKDGGLSWKTRLLPGFPQDTSTVGLHRLCAATVPAPTRSFGRAPTGSSTTAGSSSIAKRAAAARSSLLASSTTTTRRERQASQSTTSAPPSFIGSAHRQSSRVVRSAERGPRRDRATRGTGQQEAKPSVRAGVEQAARADGRQTLDGRRHPARGSADVHNRWRQHGSRCRRFPAGASTWRTRSSMARGRNAAGSCSAVGRLRHDVECASAPQPGAERRRKRRWRRQHGGHQPQAGKLGRAADRADSTPTRTTTTTAAINAL